MKGGKFSKVTIVKKNVERDDKKKVASEARAWGRTKVRKADRVCFDAAHLTHYVNNMSMRPV